MALMLLTQLLSHLSLAMAGATELERLKEGHSDMTSAFSVNSQASATGTDGLENRLRSQLSQR